MILILLWGHSKILIVKLTNAKSIFQKIDFRFINSDLIIGAVLIPGAKAPKLITKNSLKFLKKGCVLVDIAIDQGGCFETSKPTTHDEPTYKVNDVVHYCVANMPGGVARTSTIALTNCTLPYAIKIANNPIETLFIDQNLQNGLNIHKGLNGRAIFTKLIVKFPIHAVMIRSDKQKKC